ncbi:xylan 1,4-beta-xylosidase [Arthrobacter sp. PGP41]|uniref:family 43 glycosylhydrolase n=1 Tax=Arthrobacter sp. PGP41 TaxID=2079227 RepID=UPI000CDCC0F9|nr:family 43 glycosylhydrolase [Arthrobacter sp. PGP41]AUZ33076.1 xylan 1,4-beta-xylosidase [Arthrobacter sp. PGP41]
MTAIETTRLHPGQWGNGHEGQRKADRGNGTYLNPIFAGDHPDPTVLKDGDDFYMTYSSFDASPGLMLWRSKDLVNWEPIGPALPDPIAIVFAPDLVKHGDRYFIYIPFIPAGWAPEFGNQSRIFVIYADDISGPWSKPVDLGITGAIDPGHVVGEDGKRYLFTNGIRRIRLTDDGLATDGPLERVYSGWKYPEDWVTEAYALEGPKLFRHGEYFYLISAVGGTAGPPTGHMVTVARSKSIHGPWEDAPTNPIVRTQNAQESWWSRGHATLVEGPAADWWMMYHGYENGYRTLGRQVLLEPVEWTSTGWPRALGGDLSKPLLKPLDLPGQEHGIRRSDDFSGSRLDARWSFYSPGAGEADRIRLDKETLILQGKGSSPADSSPLTALAGDHAYEVSVRMTASAEDTQGGLLLFFNRRLYLGVGYDGVAMTTYTGGITSHWKEPAPPAKSIHLRIVNDRHIVTFFYSVDGENWTRHGMRIEASGYNANTAADLLSLRPALFATGTGHVHFENFQYRVLGD